MRNKRNYIGLPITLKYPDGRVLDHVAKFKSTGFKVYFNAQHLLIQLNPLERCFYEYLVEHSDINSRVFIDKNFKLSFIDFINTVIGSNIKNITYDKVNQIILKLNKLGLIISCMIRGQYYVNPKYAHKGVEKNRIKNLKNIINERLLENLPINMLVDMPNEKLFIKK